MTIQLASPDEAMQLFGLEDRNLKLLRKALPIEVMARGEVLRLKGVPSAVRQASELVNDLVSLLRDGLSPAPDYLERRIEKMLSMPPPDPIVLPAEPRDPVDSTAEFEDDVGRADSPSSVPDAPVSKSAAARQSAPAGATTSSTRSFDSAGFAEGLARSDGQAAYIQAILDNDIVFCIGPAGTGKTFLAVRMAVTLLREGQIRKLILCRPAVEAGEKLGFLPGDFHAKINPYLRPIHDALNEILDYDRVKRYVEREIIEIIPLAYMRGRTLNDAFIILDEGQNTTASQMKMFLTRMGVGSKIVVNGDTTQVDLAEGQLSGLSQAQRILQSVKGVSWVKLGGADIVRHPLVRRIVEAYERSERSRR